MIPLTRLNGTSLALNPDLVVRADANPDTVLTLVDGSKYVVAESIDEVITRVVEHRAAVLLRAGAMALDESTPPSPDRTARAVDMATDLAVASARSAVAATERTDADDDTGTKPRRPARPTVIRLRPRKG